MPSFGEAYKLCAMTIEGISVLTTLRVIFELKVNPQSRSFGAILTLPLIFYTFIFNVSYFMASFVLFTHKRSDCNSMSVQVAVHFGTWAIFSFVPALVTVIGIFYLALIKGQDLKNITRKDALFCHGISGSFIMLIMVVLIATDCGADDIYGLFCMYPVKYFFSIITGEFVIGIIFTGYVYNHYLQRIVSYEMGTTFSVFETLMLEKEILQIQNLSLREEAQSCSEDNTIHQTPTANDVQKTTSSTESLPESPEVLIVTKSGRKISTSHARLPKIKQYITSMRHQIYLLWGYLGFTMFGFWFVCLLEIFQVPGMRWLFFLGGLISKTCNIAGSWLFFQNKLLKDAGRHFLSCRLLMDAD